MRTVELNWCAFIWRVLKWTFIHYKKHPKERDSIFVLLTLSFTFLLARATDSSIYFNLFFFFVYVVVVVVVVVFLPVCSAILHSKEKLWSVSLLFNQMPGHWNHISHSRNTLTSMYAYRIHKYIGKQLSKILFVCTVLNVAIIILIGKVLCAVLFYFIFLNFVRSLFLTWWSSHTHAWKHVIAPKESETKGKR